MSDVTHALTLVQGYPLNLLMQSESRHISFPVIGWCRCGSAMISSSGRDLSCVSDAPAEFDLILDSPEVIAGIIARREWDRDEFRRDVENTVRSL